MTFDFTTQMTLGHLLPKPINKNVQRPLIVCQSVEKNQ